MKIRRENLVIYTYLIYEELRSYPAFYEVISFEEIWSFVETIYGLNFNTQH